jgi:hypothetical protein
VIDLSNNTSVLALQVGASFVEDISDGKCGLAGYVCDGAWRAMYVMGLGGLCM